MKEETTPTVNNPVEPVVSRIDDPNYVFLDDKVSYCHSDFNEEIVDDSCIYLDVEHDVWNGHLEGWSKGEATAMLSKCDAIAIARKFKLTADDLSC